MMEPKFVHIQQTGTNTCLNQLSQKTSGGYGLGNSYFLIHVSIKLVFLEMNITSIIRKNIKNEILSSYQLSAQGNSLYTRVQITLHDPVVLSFLQAQLSQSLQRDCGQGFFPSLYIHNTEYCWSPNVQGFSIDTYQNLGDITWVSLRAQSHETNHPHSQIWASLGCHLSLTNLL